MKSLKLCLFTIWLCYFYSSLAGEPFKRFDWESDFDETYCIFERIVFNRENVSLLRCVSLCASYEQCIGVFYKSGGQSCRGCNKLLTSPHENMTEDTGVMYFHVNWVIYEGSSYFLGTKPQTYANAEAYCQQMNAHLVQIETKLESEFLHDFVTRTSPTEGYWIGLLRKDIGNWFWTTSKEVATFTDWVISSRSKFSTDEARCVALHREGSFKWKGMDCLHPFRPLCEQKEIMHV